MGARLDLNEASRKLKDFCRRQRRPPSFDEIRALFGYRSKYAAVWLVNKLAENNFLKKDKKGKISFGALFGAKLLGSIQAGWPSPAEEELVDTMSLDEYLIRRPDQTYLVNVQGDSMIEAGIHPGDLVLVERGRDPKHRDIVVAQVDNEWTLKYYEKIGVQIRLVAANKKYAPIVPKQELKVSGVVVAVIRRYK